MQELGGMLKIFNDRNIDSFAMQQTLVNVIHLSYHVNRCILDDMLISENTVYLIFTCSGYGGTKFEPKSPPADYIARAIRYLLSRGFSPENLRVRVSPVIYNETGLRTLSKLLDKLKDTGLYKLQLCELNQTNKQLYNVSKDFGNKINEFNKDNFMEKLLEIARGYSIFYCPKSCEICMNPKEISILDGCIFPIDAKKGCNSIAIDEALENTEMRYYRR